MSRTRRQHRMIAILSIFVILSGAVAAPANSSVESSRLSAAERMKIAQMQDYMQLPQDSQPQSDGTAACETPSSDGAYMCLRQTSPDITAIKPPTWGDVSTAAIQPLPQWCVDAPHGSWKFNRTNSCGIFGVELETRQVVNGVSTITGLAKLNIYPYEYSSADLSTIAFQVQYSMYSGWGDATRGSVIGISEDYILGCEKLSTSFPSQPLLPFNSFKNGETYFESMVTTPGQIGYCQPMWNIGFSVPGYDTSGHPIDPNINFRCDNATAGKNVVGCVIDAYIPTLFYPSAYRSLADHVLRAQASGLPGSKATGPLTRNTKPDIEARNRALACGDAPSIDGMACDEYPFATTKNGLSAGGTRRIFTNCGFVPQPGSGPDGASACMISASDNQAQGGLNTQFNRRERMLDGDKFWVEII